MNYFRNNRDKQGIAIVAKFDTLVQYVTREIQDEETKCLCNGSVEKYLY